MEIAYRLPPLPPGVEVPDSPNETLWDGREVTLAVYEQERSSRLPRRRRPLRILGIGSGLLRGGRAVIDIEITERGLAERYYIVRPLEWQALHDGRFDDDTPVRVEPGDIIRFTFVVSL